MQGQEISTLRGAHLDLDSLSENPLASTILRAWSMMLDMSTPMTFLAPALAANMQRIPVPHPTSSTTLSLSSAHQLLRIRARRPNSLKESLVPPHTVAVRERTDSVLEHLLVDSKVSVGVGVVVSRGGEVLHMG